MIRHIQTITTLSLAIAALLCASGCSLPQRPLRDDWLLIRIAGHPVGYDHIISRRQNNPPAIVTTQTTRRILGRRGDLLDYETNTEYVESLDGVLQSIHHLSKSESAISRVTITPNGSKFEIARRLGEKTLPPKSISRKGVLGPNALRERIAQAAGSSKKTIDYKAFLPRFHTIATATVSFKGRRQADFTGTTKDYWFAEVRASVASHILHQLWLDKNGQAVRVFQPYGYEYEWIQSDEIECLQALAHGNVFDVMARFDIKVDRRIGRPYRTRNVLYEIHAPENLLTPLRLDDRRQTVEKREPGKITIRVRAHGDSPKPAGIQIHPDNLNPAPYIESDDPLIIKFSKEGVGEATTPQEKARKLTAWVRKHINRKGLTVGFASAKQVAQDRKGDCTEHAVLLAALLRAQDIPSRVAVGIVYTPQNVFGYHMWTEAYLNDWTAFDAAMNQDLVDATHIKFSASTLSGKGMTSPFAYMTRLIGKIEVKILEVE
jgi:Transglutaminase-like superfamily